MMTREQINWELSKKCEEAGIPFIGDLMLAYAILFDADLGDSDSDERFEAKAKILADEALFNTLAEKAKARREKEILTMEKILAKKDLDMQRKDLGMQRLLEVLEDIRSQLEKIDYSISCIGS